MVFVHVYIKAHQRGIHSSYPLNFKHSNWTPSACFYLGYDVWSPEGNHHELPHERSERKFVFHVLIVCHCFFGWSFDDHDDTIQFVNSMWESLSTHLRWFPQMRVPQNGWFSSWKTPSRNRWFGGTPISGNLHLYSLKLKTAGYWSRPAPGSAYIIYYIYIPQGIIYHKVVPPSHQLFYNPIN